MSETPNPRFCPSEWLDETNPLADTPEEFARRHGDGWLLIDPDEESDATTFCKGDLEPGQIVKFARLITHGNISLVVREDGSHHADIPNVPAGSTSFRLPDWEWEDSVDDLDELVRIGNGDLFCNSKKPLQPGSYVVECWTWQDDIPYRFEPDGEVPKFVICAGTN